MSLINWIFDAYQHSRINTLKQEIEQSRLSRGAAGAVDVARLETAIGELALAVKTVQRLAVEKGLCSAVEFQNKLAQIDLEDGRADGRSPVGR